MFTINLESDTRAYFLSITLIISIPTATKIFNWLINLSMKHYNIYIQTFLLLFTIGGTTGVILSNAIIDISLHDTYYVVSHFHYVLSLGTIISILIPISKYLNYYQTITLLFGMLLIFTPMHYLGFNILPRRYIDYSDNLTSISNISSIGSSLTIIS